MQLVNNKVRYEEFTSHVIANTINPSEDTSLPESAAISFVRNACIDFAKRSKVIRKHTRIDLQCGLSEYPLDGLDCERVIGVAKVRMGRHENEDCGMGWSWGNVHFEFEDTVLRVHPAPDRDIEDGLELELILQPTRESCEVDARIFEDHYDAIVNYALAEVHMMPGFVWSSVTRADYRKRLYNEAVGMATVTQVMKGRRGPLKSPPNPDFFTYRTAQRRW
mgnify:CR=1 FL=1